MLAGQILDLRDEKGPLTFQDLSEIPYLRVMPQLVEMLNFTPYKEESEGDFRWLKELVGW